MLFTDVLRQVHFPKCICMNAFVKYLFLKCICMAFNGHPSSLILGTSALRHSTWGQRGTLKAGLYGYEQSSKYIEVHSHSPNATFSAVSLNLSRPTSACSGAGIARLVESLTKKPGAILMRVRVPDAATDFSPRVNFQCRLLRCPYSPRVQSHTSTSARTLKIRNTGSHTIVWTLENTAHADRNG